jgi:hypothetical protein
MKQQNEKEWVKYSYQINMTSFNNLYPFLNDDMFGKLKKIFSLLNEQFLIVNNIILLNNSSRQYKINTFLSKNDDSFKFKYAEIIVKGLSNYYHIEFFKSKKCIDAYLLCKNINGDVIKQEELNDYRSQIKSIRNKIDRDFYTIDNIKTMIVDEVSKSENSVSDKLLNYILSYIEKYKFNFCDFDIDLRSKNYLNIKLFVKKKNKILNLSLTFAFYNKDYYCSPSYSIEFLNDDIGEYFDTNFDKAYKKLISN